MDADYTAADLEDIINQAEVFNKEQKVSLWIFLNKYEDLFDGSLGDFNVPPFELEIKEGTTSVHSMPFPVPRIHKKSLHRDTAYGISEHIEKRSM